MGQFAMDNVNVDGGCGYWRDVSTGDQKRKWTERQQDGERQEEEGQTTHVNILRYGLWKDKSTNCRSVMAAVWLQSSSIRVSTDWLCKGAGEGDRYYGLVRSRVCGIVSLSYF
jgi:hypothetical protein